jgi:4-alpha-glucanotransferase
MKHKRKSGVLLHPTSLPGPGGIGSLGEDARRFVDFLAKAGQSLWQVLPLGPTAYGNSPYSCYSAFAGNPLLLDLDSIMSDGDLSSIEPLQDANPGHVDFLLVENYKLELLKLASANFFDCGETEREKEFQLFCDNNSWLDDYALFMSLKELNRGKSWLHWPKAVAAREPNELRKYGDELATEVTTHKYIQWQFSRQWKGLKRYANERGIEIIGDIPIFVAHDSADVWANPHLFHLDEKGRSTFVAGVPPDYFSKTGQRWGNPLYNWESIAFHGYDWWVARMKSALEIYDIVRLDHFRGFEAYWEIPAKEKTAEMGRWVKGPGSDLFDTILDKLGKLPIIAEDLGVITPDVEALRDMFNFPGMKILQFAFGSGPDNPYLPHNYTTDSVVYTGTHDNDTSLGWFDEMPEMEKRYVLNYLNSDGRDPVGDLIRTALASVAGMAILPFQDILRLDSCSRMNIPGTSTGNWSWRFSWDQVKEGTAKILGEMSRLYGR